MKFSILIVLLTALSSFASNEPRPVNIVASLEISGGAQHRVIIFQNGIVRYFLGSRTSYIAQINGARINALKQTIGNIFTKPQETEKESKPNCTPRSKRIYQVSDEKGSNYVIRTEDECGFTSIKNISRIKAILEGLLALGDEGNL